MILTKITILQEYFRKLKLYDIYSIHKYIYTMFPKSDTHESRSFLFREYDDKRYNKHLIILSQTFPALDNAMPPYISKKSIDITDSFFDYSTYRFSIKVNPVMKSRETQKITPILEKEEIKNWFCTKAEKSGFRVHTQDIQIIDVGVEQFKKASHTVTLHFALLHGILRVENRDLFVNTFQHGIGRAKSFGFGLLQLDPTHIK